MDNQVNFRTSFPIFVKSLIFHTSLRKIMSVRLSSLQLFIQCVRYIIQHLVKSNKFYLCTPILKITNWPQKTLRSVQHKTPSILRPLIRKKKYSPKNVILGKLTCSRCKKKKYVSDSKKAWTL